ncbi:asparaginase domain-containing protein [Muricauda sp. 334s03]|uniref:Asparaginase domain-containing protein n=2 Tax=Flavobacteriaceae TaxID=49546 RepID=A0ABU3CZ06_9FLAO|nr:MULTISPECIES: asparaginase domain-containing protein [Flavobacteriaceae]MDF0718300.1 asparaginase domain-containing protein [[Muricauda] yonaguniensis]MDT0651603.1 asparaginase domain-containing protein [Zunongwangia sp. F297]
MITILTTGGTIEDLDNTVDKEIKKSKVTIEDFLKNANLDLEYSIESVCKKDSRTLNENDRRLIVHKIKASNATKILITHGTFTMEDTAKYIGNLNLGKTIVLVGSIILGSSANTDAPFNLGYAISSLQFLKPNVYIAMNGQIFLWNNVSKNLETNKFEHNE